MDSINIMNNDGTLNENTPRKYQGLSMLEAREKIINEMDLLGFLESIEETIQMVPYGDRSETIIEPYLTIACFCEFHLT